MKTLREEILIKKGKLSQLREQRQAIQYEIDVLCKAVGDLFYPMDKPCNYTRDIDLDRLQTYVNAIIKKREKLDPIHTELVELEKDLAEDN